MTKTATNSKKPTKYHYYFTYNRKNFCEICNGLKKRYPKMFYDSESFLTNNPFAVHFYCTPKEYKRIVAFARRRYGKIKSVSRYTHDEYLGYC